MSTYQFYKRTIESQSEIRNLCVEEEGDFFARRDKMLAQGFEVVGDLIYAPNEELAMYRFNEEMKNPLLYDCRTTPDGYLQDLIFTWMKKFRK